MDIPSSPDTPAVRAKRGRPKWIPPNLETVRALKAQGMSNASIAHVLGISEQTLYARKKDYFEFSQALQKGLAEEELVVTNALHERIKAGDTASIIWRTKTHPNMRWKEATDLNMNVSGQIDVDANSRQQEQMASFKRMLQVMTPDERDALALIMSRAQKRLAQPQQVLETSAGLMTDDEDED